MHHLIDLSKATASDHRTFRKYGIRGGDTARFQTPTLRDHPLIKAAPTRRKAAGLTIPAIAKVIAPQLGCHWKRAEQGIRELEREIADAAAGSATGDATETVTDATNNAMGDTSNAIQNS